MIPVDTRIRKKIVVTGEKITYKMFKAPPRPPGAGMIDMNINIPQTNPRIT